jgi:hypothetical protein
MSKVIEFVNSLLVEGASKRMAVLYTIEKFQLGQLTARQLWTYYDVADKETRDV